MKKKNMALSAAIAGAVISLSATGVMAHLEPKKGEGFEKCYGVVKAGKNDCASKAAKHSCAGMAKTDASKDEWVKLPSGVCDRLIGGSLAEGGAPDGASGHKSGHESDHEDDGHSHAKGGGY